MKTTFKGILKKILGPTFTSILKTKHNRIKVIKYHNPVSPYRQISENDLKTFKPVLKVWRPEKEKPLYMLTWSITQWCNYNCPYCPQSHDRYNRYGKYTAHSFDNYPLEKWLDAFSRHFCERRLSLTITGGEPMLDKKNIFLFLKHMTSMATVEVIRIDTNASRSLEAYKDIDASKLLFMCTFHPSQTSIDTFINRIKSMLLCGFRIGMVNFVMNKENINMYDDAKKAIGDLGIPLHPNPLWNFEGVYSDEDLSLLKKELPENDFYYRTKLKSPHKKKCLYPSLAYAMNQCGDVWIGCHPEVSGNFFDQRLFPTFAGPVPCPQTSCVCTDLYSFLADVNRNTSISPLFVYSDLLKKKYNIRI